MAIWIGNDVGHIHNGIYVVWLFETIFEEDQAKREETATASVEEMVHPNIIRFEVMQHQLILFKSVDLFIIWTFGQFSVTYIPVRLLSSTAT